MPRRVLLCDLDGTLVDTAPDLARAMNVILEEEGLFGLAVHEVRTLIGEGARRLIEKGFAANQQSLGPAQLDELFQRFLAYYSENLSQKSKVFPHVNEVLQDLRTKGWRLAVCTNKPVGLSHQLLKELGLAELFEAIAGGDSYKVRKPDPGHIHQLLADLGAKADEAIMFGDSQTDLKAARSADVPVILVTFGYEATPISALKPDAMIDSFKELHAALAKLS